MEGVIITEEMELYANECKEADVASRPPFLTAEEKREQIQRNHEEVARRNRNKKKES